MDLDNNINNATVISTTVNDVSAGQTTFNQVSSTVPQVTSISIGGDFPPSTSDTPSINFIPSTTSLSQPLLSSSQQTFVQTYSATESLIGSDNLHSPPTSLFTPGIPRSSVTWKQTSYVPTTQLPESLSDTQTTFSNLQTGYPTRLPFTSSPSSTDQLTPSTNSYVVSASQQYDISSISSQYTVSQYELQPTSSISKVNSRSSISLVKSSSNIVDISTTLYPSTTMVIHKSSLPGRSALGEHLSYLVAHSSSSLLSKTMGPISSIVSAPSPIYISSNTVRNTTTLYPPTTSYSAGGKASPSSSKKYSTRPLLASTTSTSIISSEDSSLASAKFSSNTSSSSIVPTSSIMVVVSSTSISTSSLPPSSSSSYYNPLYSTYTQEYYFTGSTTSFSTGIPITMTISSDNPTQTTNSPISTSAVITAPIELYNKWLNGGGLDEVGDNDTKEDNHVTNTGTIAGSVVGAVGGIIFCGIIVWFIIFKRKRQQGAWQKNRSILRDSDKNGEESSFTHSIGFRMKYQSTNNDPFRHEFEFDNRNNEQVSGQQPLRPPAIPAPRKMNPTYEAQFTQSNNERDNYINDRDNYHLRFSYASSETGTSINSSTVGSYSTISSTPSRYGSDRNDKQGFLREIL